MSLRDMGHPHSLTSEQGIQAASPCTLAACMRHPILSTRSWRALPGSLLLLLLSVAAAHAGFPQAPTTNPDTACANCHADLFKSYEQTKMAQGSGPALAAFHPGQYTDPKSGITYRVFERNDSAWMTALRPATAPAGALQTEHELSYFIGSGIHGRTYLYQQAGMWWELPINFYTRRNMWNMAPNYSGSPVLPAPLPTDEGCLHCHVTGVARSNGNARNALPDPPFAQSGIGCSACHGDAAQHLASGGHAPIVNPAKLTPERRDSACIQCHLEGDTAVFRAGRSTAGFKPGDRLSDVATYFVRASQSSGGSRSSSQYEAMMQSACKRASGDRLTCTSCHDPHSDPAPAQRVAFYRAKCIACHSSPQIATTHHPEQPDCASCHMPARGSSDIAHEQTTDHNIQRTPASQQTAKSGDLVPVAGFTAATRELGLAYAQLARTGDTAARDRATHLLVEAARAGATDDQVMLELGFLYQLANANTQAAAAYTRVLQTEPLQPAALSNLAVIRAANGNIAEAQALLTRLLDADPSQTAAGMNLALLQCRTGNTATARETVAKLQPLNPDDPSIRAFQQRGCASR